MRDAIPKYCQVYVHSALKHCQAKKMFCSTIQFFLPAYCYTLTKVESKYVFLKVSALPITSFVLLFYFSRMDTIPSANLRRQKLDQQRQMMEQRQKQKRQQQVREREKERDQGCHKGTIGLVVL
jgi:hypothetical protein